MEDTPPRLSPLERVGRWLGLTALILGGFFPFLWMVLTSIKTEGELQKFPVLTLEGVVVLPGMELPIELGGGRTAKVGASLGVAFGSADTDIAMSSTMFSASGLRRLDFYFLEFHQTIAWSK